MSHGRECEFHRCHSNDLCMLRQPMVHAIMQGSLSSYYDVGALDMAEDFKVRANRLFGIHMNTLSKIVDQFLKKEVHLHDGFSMESVYSGMAGVALLYNLYANKTNNIQQSREKAKEIIEKCLSTINPNFLCVTYLSGTSGIYVTAFEIYKGLGDTENAKKMIENVLGLSKLALHPSMPDGLLYGRAGYLYSLLLLKKNGWVDAEGDKLIRQVVTTIFSSGIRCCTKDRPKKSPIMFKWQSKKYLGAAHGLAGILHCLLLAKHYVKKKEMDDLVKPALDYLLTLRYPSGNLPSSLCCDPDTLVQWCHGASGVAHTYALAFKIFRDKKYLQAAETFGEVIWNRGLLTKGHGLCHGVCGNSYAFMSLYQTTGKNVHLFRSARFTEWTLLSFELDINVPHLFPSNYTLFEGITGVAYTLLDIQSLEKANFPGF